MMFFSLSVFHNFLAIGSGLPNVGMPLPGQEKFVGGRGGEVGRHAATSMKIVFLVESLGIETRSRE